ncbi:MAG TPA: sucrose phosphorylase [Candidatus Limnocylindrales bacterium]|nr:sucrose phosphorylase [Candidatus Limnocylindrales bacterium]
MRRGPQLITYPDSLGGDLRALERVLEGPLGGAFSGLHILPPFPSSGDRGFAPVTYDQLDPAFGTWEDIARLARRFDVALDLIVNHVSRRSAEFADFERRGRASPHADLFLTLDKVWPGGEPRPEDVALVHRRRPLPWSTYRVAATGVQERVWTTFGRDDPSEQIDLDVASAPARRHLAEQLARFAAHGVRLVRLDAVGYVVKRPGTTCFMVQPGTDQFLGWARSVAEPLGLELLAEVHAPRPVQRHLAKDGQRAYDFVLPGLVLHAFLTGSTEALGRHLATSGDHQVTTLDSHDGVPVQPDLDGVLTTAELRALVDACLARGANLSRLFTTAHLPDPAFDAHQVNIAYRSALGDDQAHVAARAIQLFAPGIPQVYYGGLLAAENDLAAVERTGEGRAVNRHDFTIDELDAALGRPVVRRTLRLLRLRREHPAFTGRLRVTQAGSRLKLEWTRAGATAGLEVDLSTAEATITTSGAGEARSRGPV